jgi:hypothetical protein
MPWAASQFLHPCNGGRQTYARAAHKNHSTPHFCFAKKIRFETSCAALVGDSAGGRVGG